MSVSIDDVRAAAARLDGVAHRTPIFTSRTLDERTGARVTLKAESLQRSGAFKFRGAYNAVAALPEEQRARGVLAYSSGNHAGAIALAASLLGAPAVDVMPTDAPPTKRAAAAGYGAEIVTYDRYTGDREAIGRALADERGLTLIPPYDHPNVVAGQGTAALELLEDVPELDVLIVPVGGGGLISGCATVVDALSPTTCVVGVEPAAGDDFRRSLAAGKRLTIPVPQTVADGLQTTAPGVITFEIARRLVDEIVTVGDDELVDAMAFLFERTKLVVEPSGAAGVAALLHGRVEAAGRRVGVILSGGNIGAERFRELTRARTAPAPA